MKPTSDPLTLSNPSGERSLLATGVRLSGDLSVPGSLEVYGQVDGRISADMIIIEATGEAQGELHARSVTIRGRFDGRVFSTDLKLTSSARVRGELSCATLAVESGAEVNASCTHKTDRNQPRPEVSFRRRSNGDETGAA